MLRASGSCVGLYTSPYIESLYERIDVDGVPVSERTFLRAVEVAGREGVVVVVTGSIHLAGVLRPLARSREALSGLACMAVGARSNCATVAGIARVRPRIHPVRGGGLVAFPTETVYGLGANALNPDAVAKIFEAKQRPSFDPLIVHITERTSLISWSMQSAQATTG